MTFMTIFNQNSTLPHSTLAHSKKTVTIIMMGASLAIASAIGCASLNQPSAVAQLQATKGNTASGVVAFTQIGDVVRVDVQIQGLKPNTVHGFHVHEKGDCSSGDGLSAGGHFNPTAHNHGFHGSGVHHSGDLPPLNADAQGSAVLRFYSTSISIGSGITNVIGHGLIVHRDPDDFTTQPTGNSGPRLACAVITAS
jgi:superoxide dismutase, Cu-Zn family